MNVKSIDTATKNWVTLTIEVGPEEFEQALVQAYHKNASKMNVPGFRKGKAPRKVIERLYGESVFFEDAVNIACPKAYAEAIKECGIDPLDQADMNILDISAEGFSFEAKVPVAPELTLGQYKGLSAVMTEAVVAEADVDAEIERLRERNARQETVDEPAQNGDDVMLDYEGSVGGVPFDGGKAEGQWLKLGSNRFIPGFEEQLVGASAGDSVTVSVTFPEQYHAEELAGQNAEFACVVHEVKRSIKPELDDELAKDVSEFDTLDELKSSIREKLLASRKQEADHAFEEALIDQLIAGADVEPHDFMVERRLDNIMENFATRLQQQRITLDTWLRITNQTVEDLENQNRPLAERLVKTSLIFDKVAELEGLSVTEEELEAEYARLAELYKMDVDRVKLSLDADMIRKDLCSLKASELIKASAVRLEPNESKEV